MIAGARIASKNPHNAMGRNAVASARILGGTADQRYDHRTAVTDGEHGRGHAASTRDMVLVRLLGPQMKLGSVAARAAEVTLVVVTFIVGLLGAEIAFRSIDDYQLWSARLVRRPTSPLRASPAATDATSMQDHAARISLAAGMKREWFDLSPPPISRKSLNQTFERIAKR